MYILNMARPALSHKAPLSPTLFAPHHSPIYVIIIQIINNMTSVTFNKILNHLQDLIKMDKGTDIFRERNSYGTKCLITYNQFVQEVPGHQVVL